MLKAIYATACAVLKIKIKAPAQASGAEEPGTNNAPDSTARAGPAPLTARPRHLEPTTQKHRLSSVTVIAYWGQAGLRQQKTAQADIQREHRLTHMSIHGRRPRLTGVYVNENRLKINLTHLTFHVCVGYLEKDLSESSLVCSMVCLQLVC